MIPLNLKKVVRQFGQLAEIYEAPRGMTRKNLLSSVDIFSELSAIYSRIGQEVPEYTMPVRIWTPQNEIPLHRIGFQEATLEKYDGPIIVAEDDPNERYTDSQAVVLAPREWMIDRTVRKGESIVILARLI